LLAQWDGRASGAIRWVVEQGFEMGRPSILEVEADREGGRTTAVRVGGAVVMMSEGTIDVPDLG
jgi:trans-2,3-dihydro-3-hydroxyanthranilate isomerase